MELFRTGGQCPDTNYIFMVGSHSKMYKSTNCKKMQVIYEVVIDS